MADVQQITERVVTLLGRVPRHLLIGTQLFFQKAQHDSLIWDILTEAIAQGPVQRVVTSQQELRFLPVETSHSEVSMHKNTSLRRDVCAPETDVLLGVAGGFGLCFHPQRHRFSQVTGEIVPESLQPQDHPVQRSLQLSGAPGGLHGQHEGTVQLSISKDKTVRRWSVKCCLKQVHLDEADPFKPCSTDYDESAYPIDRERDGTILA